MEEAPHCILLVVSPPEAVEVALHLEDQVRTVVEEAAVQQMYCLVLESVARTPAPQSRDTIQR